MLLLRKPSPSTIHDLLATQAQFDLTYSGIGTTASTPPHGYVVDRTRIKLGEGQHAFVAGKAALERWDHFRLGWVEACPSNTPIKVGQVVGILARNVGLWWLNACRIVYVVDEDVPVMRFGFAYGTLPGHVESGEERFLVEWDRTTGSVYYDIIAFSRPRHILARLGYPWVRRLQKRFARDSAAAMVRAVAKAT